MKIIIFNLNNTLVNTQTCKPYLHRSTAVGRLVEKIERREITTAPFEQGIVEYFNTLSRNPGLLVLVVSDSPKAYCKAVFHKHGFNITNEHIFGDQGKPCVDFYDKIIAPLAQLHGKDLKQCDCLVVGNSPKDLYFGHYINSPMIYSVWGSDIDPTSITDDIKPAFVVKNLAELKASIATFIAGGLAYAKPDLKRNVRTVNPANTKIVRLNKNNIGYARDYIPSAALPGNTNGLAHYTWMDINFTLKRAKEHCPHKIRQGEPMPICFDGVTMHRGLSLKSLARRYFADFVKWVKAKGLKGAVALVPVPCSVPKVCNRSNPILQVCCWWVEWAAVAKLPCEFHVCDILERWQPVEAAHVCYLQLNERLMKPHLESIGATGDSYRAVVAKASAFILFDDVISTVTQMNAASIILSELNLCSLGVPIYGWSWAKTAIFDQ